MMHKVGKFRGEKVRYPDGEGCSIWIPFSLIIEGDEEEDGGLCFDFPSEDIDDLIALLVMLKSAEAKEYKLLEFGKSMNRIRR